MIETMPTNDNHLARGERMSESWAIIEVDNGRAWCVRGGGNWYTEDAYEWFNAMDEWQTIMEEDEKLKSILDASYDEPISIKLTGILIVEDETDWGNIEGESFDAWIEYQRWEFVKEK